MQKLALELEIEFDKIINDEIKRIGHHGNFGGFSGMEWGCIAKLVKAREDKLRKEFVKALTKTFKWNPQIGQYATDDDAFIELKIRITDPDSIPGGTDNDNNE